MRTQVRNGGGGFAAGVGAVGVGVGVGPRTTSTIATTAEDEKRITRRHPHHRDGLLLVNNGGGGGGTTTTVETIATIASSVAAAVERSNAAASAVLVSRQRKLDVAVTTTTRTKIPGGEDAAVVAIDDYDDDDEDGEDGENRCTNLENDHRVVTRRVVVGLGGEGKASIVGPLGTRKGGTSSFPSSSSGGGNSTTTTTPSPKTAKKIVVSSSSTSSSQSQSQSQSRRSPLDTRQIIASSSPLTSRPSPSSLVAQRRLHQRSTIFKTTTTNTTDRDPPPSRPSSSAAAVGSSAAQPAEEGKKEASSSVLMLSEKFRLGPGKAIEVEKDKPTWESRRRGGGVVVVAVIPPAAEKEEEEEDPVSEGTAGTTRAGGGDVAEEDDDRRRRTSARSDARYLAAISSRTTKNAVPSVEKASLLPDIDLPSVKGTVVPPKKKEEEEDDDDDDRAEGDGAPSGGGNAADGREAEESAGGETTREDASPSRSDFATRMAWAKKLEKQKMKVEYVRKAMSTASSVDNHIATARKGEGNNGVAPSFGARATNTAGNGDGDRAVRTKGGCDVGPPCKVDDITEDNKLDGPSSTFKDDANELSSPSLDKRNQLYEKYEKRRQWHNGASKKRAPWEKYEDTTTVPVVCTQSKDQTTSAPALNYGTIKDAYRKFYAKDVHPEEVDMDEPMSLEFNQSGEASETTTLSATPSLQVQEEPEVGATKLSLSSVLSMSSLIAQEKQEETTMVSMPGQLVHEKSEKVGFSQPAGWFGSAEDVFTAFKSQCLESPTDVVEKHDMANTFASASNDEEEMVAFATSAFDSDVFCEIEESTLENKEQGKDVENSAVEQMAECMDECHEFASERKVNEWCGESADDFQDEDPHEVSDAKDDGVAIRVKSFQAGLTGEQQILLSDIIADYEAKIMSRKSEVESLKGEMTMQHMQIQSLLGKEQERAAESDDLIRCLHKEISNLRLHLEVTDATLQNGGKDKVGNARRFLSILRKGTKKSYRK